MAGTRCRKATGQRKLLIDGVDRPNSNSIGPNPLMTNATGIVGIAPDAVRAIDLFQVRLYVPQYARTQAAPG